MIVKAGLLLTAAIPLAKDALTDPVAIVSPGLLFATEFNPLWIILGAGFTSLTASALSVVPLLPLG